MSIFLGILVFLLNFISDTWAVRWYLAATNHKAAHAALYTGLLALAGAADGWLFYKVSASYLIPEVLGACLGTYYAVSKTPQENTPPNRIDH